MVKKKFELTDDLIKIDGGSDNDYEPVSETKPKKNKNADKTNMFISIDSSLRKKVKMWCFMNEQTISSFAEEALAAFIDEKEKQ